MINMEVFIKPFFTLTASIIRVFEGNNYKKETINGQFERTVITVAGLTVALLFIVLLVIGIFYPE